MQPDTFRIHKGILPLLLGVTIPFSITLSNYLFVATFALVFITSKRRKKIQWLPMNIMLIPVFIPLISLVLHGQAFEVSQLEVRTPFLVTAIAFGFFKIDPDDFKALKPGLVLGSILGAALLLLVQTGVMPLFAETNWIDLAYIPLFIVISLIILFYTDINIHGYAKIILAVMLNICLIFIGNIFFLVAGILVSASAIIVKGSRMQSRITVMVIVLLGALVLYKGAEINEYIESKNTYGDTPENKTAQWLCVLEVVKGKEFVGVGYGEKRNLLIECYDDKDMTRAEEKAFNSHNEYLDAFLTLGYLGVIALMLYFIHAMFLAYDSKQTALLLIIMLIALFALNENIFTRQKGVMITSLIYLLIYANYYINRKKAKKEEDEVKQAMV